MAMSGTERMNNQLRRESRRRENDFAPRENEFGGSPGHGTTAPSRPSRPASTPGARPTRQLEFTQAMADFKYMFPTMEEEVIEAVLRANNGIVDATIDQLLTMNIDSEEETSIQVAKLSLESMMEERPRSPRDKKEAYAYSSKKRSPSHKEEKKAPPLSPISPPMREPHPVEESPPSYSEVIQSPQMMAAAAPFFPPAAAIPRQPAPSLLDMPPEELTPRTEPKTPASFWSEFGSGGGGARLRRHFSTGGSMKKTRYHNWNPPLLGNLPEDFLRLTPHPAPAKTSPQSQSATSASRSRRVQRTMSMPSQVLATHDLSSDILTERLRENERKRHLGGADMNPETMQYLEDERLALILQNSEFLQELRDNHVFMETLERDRQSAVASTPEPAEQKPTQEPPKPADTVGADAIEGYGTDRQDTLGAFPFSKDAPVVERDEDAELRRKLKHMGKASRKQFAALARRFFSIRRKKFPRQILKEQPAPSMANLLESDEEEETTLPPREPTPGADSSPRALSTLPSYRTVQRPPYQPDMVVSYNTDHSSMV